MSTNKTCQASADADSIPANWRTLTPGAREWQPTRNERPPDSELWGVGQDAPETECTTSTATAHTVNLTGRQICLAVRDADADFGAALAKVGKAATVPAFVAASNKVLEAADVRAVLSAVQREYNSRTYCRTKAFGVRQAAEYIILRDKLRSALEYIASGSHACESRPLMDDGSDPHPIAAAYDEVRDALDDVNRHALVAFNSDAMPIVLDIAAYE